MIGQHARDLWAIYRLQKQGVPLDLRAAMLRPDSAFYRAVARSMPGFGLWAGRVTTLVVRERGRTGFVQARWRNGGIPAQDLLFIAPSLDARQGVTWLWQRLLHDLVQVSGSKGVQRLFAHLPEQRHAEVEVMRQSGFAIFAQDRLYRLMTLPPEVEKLDTPWVPQEKVDGWGLNRLYTAVTPAVVQQAESVLHDNGDGHAGGWGNPRQGCYVLRGSSAGDVLGYLRLTRGEHAHWVKLVLHPERVNQNAALLQQGLSLMANWPRRPVYCDVRDYEGFLADPLERCGFERVMTRLLLVRHTTVSLRVKVAKPLPVMEGVPEAAPSPF